MNNWSREHKISLAQVLVGLAGVIVTLLLGVGSYFIALSTPEIRKRIWATPEPTPRELSSRQIPTQEPIGTPNPTKKHESISARVPTPRAEVTPVERVSAQLPQSTTSPLPAQATPRALTRPRNLDQAVTSDIGQARSNGFYELTLENVTISDSARQFSCGAPVGPQEQAVAVRFTIKGISNSVSAYTRKTGDTDFLLVDQQGKRFERVCGDGWYGGRARTITLVYVLHTNSRELKFRFHNVGYGDAISFVVSASQ